MSLINATAIPSSGSYEIEQSLRFNQADSAYLSRTPASASNRKTWTFSCWVKKSSLATVSPQHAQTLFEAYIDNDNRLRFYFDDTGPLSLLGKVGGTKTMRMLTNATYRDFSAWLHIVLAIDTTQGTNTNRLKLYVNGEQITSFTSNLTYPPQNGESPINATNVHNIGAGSYSGGLYAGTYLNGYMGEVNFIDGQQLTPADFGETGKYGEWKPKEYSGTYGTNGFYLPFKQDYSVEGFSTVTYKGSAANHYIGGVGFSPDLVWTKSRSTAGKQHILVDKIRGGDKNLMSDSTEAENSSANRKISLGAADGYVIDSNSGHLNESDKTYVSWNWDMGADTPTGFGCVTYKGNGTTGQTISGVGFQPDFLWIKNRTDGNSSFLYDAVRGAKNYLQSDAAGAQATTNQMTAFNVDGFTVDEDGGSATNDDGDNFVAWAWNMGGSNASNTSGSINSTVRANTTYGQSIVSYTGNGTAGATVGHGLNSTPEMIIVKNTQNNYNWQVFHTSIGNTGAVFLDLGSAPDTGETTYWNNTSPTNALFSLGTNTKANGNNNPHIAYCFHSVSGYSKFGSYSGNGSATGTSVTTGFRPAFLMIKKNAASNWLMFDNVRSDSIVTDIGENLHADYPRSEAGCASAQIKVDFNATGFQLKGTSADINGNGDTYIYMCFAGGADAVSTVNTTGSIDSRVKANPTYGQSIVSYIGTGGNKTVGHGLSAAPEMLIVKARSAGGENWRVYHSGIASDAETDNLNLNLTTAAADADHIWNDTAPTSSLFSIGVDGGVNANGTTYIAYCFHSVTGYSKIGSYSGTGSAGNEITLGFAPAFVMIKSATNSDEWGMYDNVRQPSFQSARGIIYANQTAAEDTSNSTWLTLGSNSFTWNVGTSSAGGFNASGETYVYVAFADKREYAYWLDQSGNNNDWTSNNLTESDVMVDSPTNSFCTMNPLATGSHTEPDTNTYTTKEGNLESKWTGVASAKTMATMAPTDGKWYWEFYIKTPAETARGYVGLGEFEDITYNSEGQNGESNYHIAVGNYSRVQAYGNEFDNVYPTPAQYDVYSIAIDWSGTSGKFWFRINGGAWQGGGNPATGATPTKSYAKTVANASMMPYHASGSGSSSNVSEIVFNFGQDSSFASNKTAQGNQDSGGVGDFYYAPPSGFLALCTSNLPDVDVTPSEHFNTVLWTGNGTTGTNITNVGFAPSLTWLKGRDIGSDPHQLYDTVRGATKSLKSNGTDTESTRSTGLTAFGTDGFTIGNHAYVNRNTSIYVAFNWKANGSGSSNTNGSINSTVSANVDAGFSIVSYTGDGGTATVGHGLSSAPEMIMLKTRDTDQFWVVYHANNTSAPETDYLSLNGTNATADDTYWDDTAPTNALFSLRSGAAVNKNNDKFIAYCFHSVDGYSKVGSYTGNNSADGVFVYLGFRPMWIMVKRTDANGMNWMLFRHDDKQLEANTTSVEFGGDYIDMLSNGFKARTQANMVNDSANYIYLAFAETPFKYSNAR